MIYGIYAYRDNKVGFGPIWHDVNDEVAARGFSQMMSMENSPLGFTPNDFDLFKVGTYNSETGQVEQVFPPEYIISGRAAYRRKDIEDEE